PALVTVVVLVLALLFFIALPQFPLLWRLRRWNWRVYSSPGSKVILQYPIELQHAWPYPAFHRCCEQEVVRMSLEFGMPLDRKVLVFLLPSSQAVSELLAK